MPAMRERLTLRYTAGSRVVEARGDISRLCGADERMRQA
jgi:hypothetical protein